MRERGKDMSFFELYKHPLWQKKRLEIMAAAGFRCQHCGNNQKQLNVHHAYYAPNAKPWDYENDFLRCLCDECHQLADEDRKTIQRWFGRLECGSTREALGFVAGLLMRDGKLLAVDVFDFCFACGVAKAFSNRPEIHAGTVIGMKGQDCEATGETAANDQSVLGSNLHLLKAANNAAYHASLPAAWRAVQPVPGADPSVDEPPF
jgi:hypothetical protein